MSVAQGAECVVVESDQEKFEKIAEKFAAIIFNSWIENRNRNYAEKSGNLLPSEQCKTSSTRRES
jgi:hypothetical protein